MFSSKESKAQAVKKQRLKASNQNAKLLQVLVCLAIWSVTLHLSYH